MIISIRGTSGSGKSWIVRELMTRLRKVDDLYLDGRKWPIASRWMTPKAEPLIVAGKYSVQQGGCDTIREGRAFTFGLFSDWTREGNHVVYEGLLISNEFARTVELSKRVYSPVIFLATPLPTCIAAINARRLEKGVDKPVDTKLTKRKHDEMRSVAKRLRAQGVKMEYLDRNVAFERVCQLLGVETDLIGLTR